MAEHARAGALAGLALGLCWAFAAQGASREEAALAAFAAAFAGEYDNRGQVQSEAAQGRIEEALRLSVVRIRVPALADYVFYVHEASAADPRRVFAQRVWLLAPGPGRGALQLVPHDLREPQRWRAGHRDADVFKSLLPQDLLPRTDCTLRWRELPERGRWQGSTAPRTCRDGAGGDAAFVDLGAELDAAAYALSERVTDAAGTVRRERAGDPWVRFLRLAP